MPLLSAAYLETISQSAQASGKYVRQKGDAPKYAEVTVSVEPLSRGSGVQIANALGEDRIAGQFIPDAVLGIVETVQEGVLAGYALTDMRITLQDGTYHAAHSTHLSFRIAASIALRDAVKKASPLILSPVMKVSFVVPREALQTVQVDVRRMGGMILHSEVSSIRTHELEAVIPLPALLQARAWGGRESSNGSPVDPNACHFYWPGKFSMQFSHYEVASPELQKRLIEEAQGAQPQR